VTPSPPRTTRAIFLFWLPLAATWVMMALEGPFLAAIIARLADPAFNLAAYGVAFAFGILIESPVIMLLSASTALVVDRDSYVKLRNFANALNVGCTALLLVVLIPPFYDALMRDLLNLPDEVASLAYGALWLLLPWPAAIGYRRFIQGVLIRTGRTRLVAIGTVLRLAGMALTALFLFLFTDLPGAWVGTASMTIGVTIEAGAARLMAVGTIRELMHGPGLVGSDEAPLGYRDITRFYYPLALTSLIGLTVQPLLTFFMGRAPAPVESLAVFPVIHALSFLFRALGLSFQEVAIALLGPRSRHFPELARFATGLAAAAAAGYAIIAFTPLASFWFGTLSGLTPELTAFAITPARILVLIPALSVLLSLQRAVLVQDRRTRPITVATGLELAFVALVFVTLGWWFELVGVVAASIAFTAGRLVGVGYLIPTMVRSLRSPR
jgi:progressive ankylosis protein